MACMLSIEEFLESTSQPSVPKLGSVLLNNVLLRMFRAPSPHYFQGMLQKHTGKTPQLNSRLQVFTQILSQER